MSELWANPGAPRDSAVLGHTQRKFATSFGSLPLSVPVRPPQSAMTASPPQGACIHLFRGRIGVTCLTRRIAASLCTKLKTASPTLRLRLPGQPDSCRAPPPEVDHDRDQAEIVARFPSVSDGRQGSEDFVRSELVSGRKEHDLNKCTRLEAFRSWITARLEVIHGPS